MELYFKLRFVTDIICLILVLLLVLLTIILCTFDMFKKAVIKKYMISHGYERKLYNTPSTYYWVKSNDSNDYVFEKSLFNMKLKYIKNKYK